MRRRTCLATLGGALGGCIGGQIGGKPETTTLGRTVAVVDADKIPARFDTEATVEVVESEITAEQTARLRVAVRNTGEKRRTYAFDPKPPMGHERSESGPGTLLLARPESLEREDSDCWRPSPVGHGDGRATVELAPGEAIENTLRVWDVGESECLPPGDYRFSAPYPRYEGGRDVQNVWSFTLSLERA